MSERTHEHVKDVDVDHDCLVIELLNGLRLSGPLRTKPVYRDPVMPADVLPRATGDFVHTVAAP